MITSAAAGKNVSIIFDDNLHDISLQGPVAADFLAAYAPGIHDLVYFVILQSKLFGCPVMISGTGYTDVRGYSIFCQKKNVVGLWDQILEGGKDMGTRSVLFSTLDRLRTESYLLNFPGDNSETYPWKRRSGR